MPPFLYSSTQKQTDTKHKKKPHDRQMSLLHSDCRRNYCDCSRTCCGSYENPNIYRIHFTEPRYSTSDLTLTRAPQQTHTCSGCIPDIVSHPQYVNLKAFLKSLRNPGVYPTPSISKHAYSITSGIRILSPPVPPPSLSELPNISRNRLRIILPGHNLPRLVGRCAERGGDYDQCVPLDRSLIFVSRQISIF